MKKEVPLQLVVGVGILVAGGILLGGEYFWVRWAPAHRQRVADETLKLLPFHDDALGVDMQVAAGIYGKVENLPGGVKIFRPRFWGVGPSLTITSEPNADHAKEFSQEIIAKWMTDGDTLNLARYRFDHLKIMDHEAGVIQQLKDHAMLSTAHVLSPERIIVAECSTGAGEDWRALLMEACEESLRTIKVAGPPPVAGSPKLEDVSSPTSPPRVISH